MTDKFWIASYSYSGAYKESLKPNVGEKIWQWGSKGRVKGINGDVDMDIFYETVPSTEKAVQTTASVLNIRKYPSAADPSATIVGTLKKGSVVSVEEDSLWYKVNKGSLTGWASAKYIKK